MAYRTNRKTGGTFKVKPNQIIIVPRKDNLVEFIKDGKTYVFDPRQTYSMGGVIGFLRVGNRNVELHNEIGKVILKELRDWEIRETIKNPR